MLGGRTDDAATRRVINRPRAKVPAIQMACNDDDRQFRVGPRHFGQHIARGLHAYILQGKLQLHAHRLPAGNHPFKVLRVGNRQCACRNRSDARFEIGVPGMWVAVIVRADGADDDGRRAFLGSNIRSDKAGRAKCAITATVLRCLHIVADKGDFAFQAAVWRSAQVVDGREIDDLRIQSRLAGATAIAKCGNSQLLRKWRGDFSGLFAAHPCGHLIFFNADIFEAQRP